MASGEQTTGDLDTSTAIAEADSIVANVGAVTEQTPVSVLRTRLNNFDQTFNGDVVADTFTGNGAGLTGITGATGGVSNLDSTTVAADTNVDGTGEVDLQTRNLSRLKVQNDGDIEIAQNVGIGTATPTAKLDVVGAIVGSSSVTAAGRIISDDVTDATTTTDGSIQTDGGLSVVKDVFVGGKITASGLDIPGISGKNLYINGSISVPQKGISFTSATTPANNNDTYLIDQNILLSDGNNIVDVTQQSGGGVSGNADYMRMDVETISKKFGNLHIIENKNCKSIIGGVASVSFDLRVSDITKLGDIRAVVVSWDSTADVVTSDIISAWGAEGANPTLITNWTEENVAVDLSVTASWARYKIENISIDTASTTNIGVFIYQNNVATNDTVGIFLEITEIQIEQGSVATPFEHRLYGDELALCQRYYYRVNGEAGDVIGNGTEWTSARYVVGILHPVPMRTNTPVYIPPGATEISMLSGSSLYASTSNSTNAAYTIYGDSLDIRTASGAGAGSGALARFNTTSWYSYDTEL